MAATRNMSNVLVEDGQEKGLVKHMQQCWIWKYMEQWCNVDCQEKLEKLRGNLIPMPLPSP
jgi:hypothetical protein